MNKLNKHSQTIKSERVISTDIARSDKLFSE